MSSLAKLAQEGTSGNGGGRRNNNPPNKDKLGVPTSGSGYSADEESEARSEKLKNKAKSDKKASKSSTASATTSGGDPAAGSSTGTYQQEPPPGLGTLAQVQHKIKQPKGPPESVNEGELSDIDRAMLRAPLAPGESIPGLGNRQRAIDEGNYELHRRNRYADSQYEETGETMPPGDPDPYTPGATRVNYGLSGAVDEFKEMMKSQKNAKKPKW